MRPILRYALMVLVCSGSFITPALAQRIATTPVPLCLVYADSSKYLPCSGTVPVDPVTGNPLSNGVTYTNAPSSPVTLSSSWKKVVTTTKTTRALRISATADTATYDIEWTSVPANSPAPTDTYGIRLNQGSDFTTGFPLGDVYLKSATSQKAVIKIGS